MNAHPLDTNVRDLVAFGHEHSPSLRRRMDAAQLSPSDIQSVADLAKLPVLRKEELVQLQRDDPATLGGLLTVPIGSLRRIFQSPGPIHDPEPNVPDSWRWASAMRAAGLGPGDVVINCFGYHLTPAGVMFEEGARAVGCAVVPAGIGNQAQQIEVIESLGVTAFAGLPSYLKGLLDKAKEQGHDPSRWRIRKAIVAAEPLPPSLRKLLLDEHGVECFNVYGTAECGNLGYEDASHNGWILPDDALVQVCDLNTGQPCPPGLTGEVVVTLFRRDYVLIRFGVGDLSALMPNVAPPRLVGWLGRSGDSVKVRGIFVHPRQCDEAMRHAPGVARYQIVVTRVEHRDELTCRIMASPSANAESLIISVGDALHDALKLKCKVEVVESLPDDAKRFTDARTWD